MGCATLGMPAKAKEKKLWTLYNGAALLLTLKLEISTYYSSVNILWEL